MRYPIIDMHCDLLSYLNDGRGRSPCDPEARASLPFMQQGGVILQVLAIYVSNTSDAPLKCRKQIQSFLRLEQEYKKYIQPKEIPLLNEDRDPSLIHIMPAFENAAGFCSETDPIGSALNELDKFRNQLGSIGYISLTWDGENRYGGGVGSSIGLKEDGKQLLEWMNERQIPVDISHASDYLAYDIFNLIHKNNMSLPVLASHSNMRAISPMARNLPDEVIKELIERNGLIGINFFRHFSGGKDPRALSYHIHHALSLGAEDVLCCGADFFEDADPIYIKQKYNSAECFYQELGNSSCYPHFFDILKEELSLEEKILEKISYKNAYRFLRHQLDKK